MAMQQIAPVAVNVTAHWWTGTPQAVAFEGIVRKVTKVLAMRQEHGAYRADSGPRTLWELETQDATLVIAFSRRSGAWTIEAFDDSWSTLPFASALEVPGGLFSHA